MTQVTFHYKGKTYPISQYETCNLIIGDKHQIIHKGYFRGLEVSAFSMDGFTSKLQKMIDEDSLEMRVRKGAGECH